MLVKGKMVAFRGYFTTTLRTQRATHASARVTPLFSSCSSSSSSSSSSRDQTHHPRVLSSVAFPRCRSLDLLCQKGNRRKEEEEKLERRVGWRGLSAAVSRSASERESERESENENGRDAVVKGRVVSHRANFVHVRLQQNESPAVKTDTKENGTIGEEGEGGEFEKEELLCVTRQVLKKMKRSVLVGDFVEVSSIDWTLGHGVVNTVLPRKSIFQTPAVANVEIAIVMFSLKDPPLEQHQINRFLVAAEGADLPEDVVVVLNKRDLVPEEVTQSWVKRLESWGYNAIPVSTREGLGVDKVCDALEGKLGVIVGPSGVGKSSLINAINTSSGVSRDKEVMDTLSISGVDEDQSSEVELLDVGEVSARTGRGKHTTRNISLINLSNGGFLADTPGFNQPRLLNITARELPGCFPEITERLKAGKCDFKNCVHIKEPGCAVKGDWERYPMYVSMYEEVKLMEDQAKKMGSKKEKREGDVRMKTRQGGKIHAEPRLNRKKHRRTSRKLSKQQFKQAVLEDNI